MKTQCPGCGLEFDAKRHSYGAGYALKWDKLKKKHIEILSWWISNHPYEWLTKDNVRDKFKRLTVGSVESRLSEMKAWHLIIPDKDEKGSYKLDIPLVSKVLNAGGKLKGVVNLNLGTGIGRIVNRVAAS